MGGAGHQEDQADRRLQLSAPSTTGEQSWRSAAEKLLNDRLDELLEWYLRVPGGWCTPDP